MATIGANALLLSDDVLAKWLIEDFPFRIQLSANFPFLPVGGHELRYATTDTLTPGVAIDQGATIPEDTKDPQLIKAKKRMKKKAPTRRKTEQYWNEQQFLKVQTSPPGSLSSNIVLFIVGQAYCLAMSLHVATILADDHGPLSQS